MGDGANVVDGVYYGGEENTWAKGTSADETFDLGSGNDDIEFDISGAALIGNNRVVLSKNENLTVTLTGDDSTTKTEIEQSGKDVIVSVYMTKSGYGKIKLGTITFEDPYGNIHPDGIIIKSQNGHVYKDLYAKYIDKSKAKKGQTIKGSFYNENITGRKKSDKIYTGAGNDYIDPGKGKDTIIVNGGGKKEIELGSNSGNNTIKFTGEGKEAKTTLYYGSNSYNEYRKVGKNLYIDNYSKYTYKKNSTDTLSNYFDIDLDSSLNNLYINGTEKTLKEKFANATIQVYGDKKGNVQGTNYHDYLNGSKKADKIHTGIGEDTVKGGKGNDKIYLDSTGYKTVVINNGEGNDTIYLNSFTEDFNLVINGADDIRKGVSSDGKDLILYRTFNSGKTIKTEKTIIKDFGQYWKYGENGGNANLYINGQEYNPVNLRNEDKSLNVQMTRNYTIDSSVYQNKFFGTKKADNVTIQGSGSVKMILTGGGNDTITVKNTGNTISAGQGNDTINVLTSGDIYINHTTGDGNDTITIGNPMPNSIDIDLKLQGNQFNSFDAADYYSDYFVSMRQGFSINGEDLVMQIPSGLNKFETITFKGYYAEGSKYDPSRININITVNENKYNNKYTGTLEKCFEKWAFWATGVYDSVSKRTIYESTPDHTNYFYYGGKGKATMLGSTSSSDKYLATLNKNSNLVISDSADSDYLYINAKQSNLRTFFNVDKYGRVDVRGDGISDDLFIFNKSSLTAKNLKNAFNNNGSGFIRIDNFFENSGSQYTKSDGYIENIFIGKNITDNFANSWENGWYDAYENKFNTDAMVYVVAEKVAGWLANHTQYNDAMDVINTGSSKDVNALLKLYASEHVFLDKNLI